MISRAITYLCLRYANARCCPNYDTKDFINQGLKTLLKLTLINLSQRLQGAGSGPGRDEARVFGGFRWLTDIADKRISTMRTFDLSPLMRSTVGFENLNRLVDYVTRLDAGDVAYPPYDIAKLDEDRYRISMAVAGFKRDELDIMVQDNVLTVSAKAGESEDDTVYLHRGIARRAFERRFQLADTVKVVGADLVDGLLNIELVREVPEHMKPRQIKIGSGPLKAKLLKPKAA